MTPSLLALHHQIPRYTMRNVFETIAVRDGRKPVMRLVFQPPDLAAAGEVFRAAGLAVAESDWRLVPAYTTSLRDVFTAQAAPGTPGDCVVAVSREAALASQFLEAEREGDAEAVAELLGYPRCCAAAYQSLAPGVDWLAQGLQATPLRETYPWECNRIAYLFDEHWLGFDYFPCAFDCDATRALGQGLVEPLRRCGLAPAVDRAIASMRTPVLLHRGVIAQLVGAERAGSVLDYDLSRARLFGWDVQSGADESPVWDGGRARRKGGRVRFSRGSMLLAELDESVIGTRLMLFEGA